MLLTNQTSLLLEEEGCFISFENGVWYGVTFKYFITLMPSKMNMEMFNVDMNLNTY